MCSVPIWIFCVITLALAASDVHSLIHFEEVEYDDPVQTGSDGSVSNQFVCKRLGEECQTNTQCCGIATCTVPSKSETAVCIVPNYKYDEGSRKFLAIHNLRPSDIQYIRDSYNTSQYDFLLTDLTFSAPPLEIAENPLEPNVADNSKNIDSGISLGDVARNESTDANQSLEMADGSLIVNFSSEENYEQHSSFFDKNTLERFNNSTVIVSNQHLLGTDLSNDTYLVTDDLYNSTNPLQNDKLDLTKHLMFLLLNNTLESSDSKIGLNDLYNQITNTDRFKNVVERLRAKLIEINQFENTTRSTQSTTGVENSGAEDVLPVTERTKTNESKWNIVRKFFLHNKNKNINNFTSMSYSNLKETEDGTIPKQIPVAENFESINGDNIPVLDENNNNDNEKFKKIFEDVDKIEDIIDSDKRINSFQKSKNLNEGDLIDFYNIDVPFSSFHDNSGKNDGMNNSLESVFKDIGDTISSMMNRDDDQPIKTYFDSKIDEGFEENNNLSTPYSNTTSSYNKTTFLIETSAQNKTHIWNRIHFWHVPHNLSKRLQYFFFPKKERASKNESKPLNEYILLNLNSNNEETPKTSQREESEVTPELMPDFSSESSGTEDLYNNSYVFVMHKEQFLEPKLSNWKKVINFFHREKEAPLTVNINDQDIVANPFDTNANTTTMKSKLTQSDIEAPKIIRLPEHLMPEFLNQRESNETDWFLQDSEDYNDGQAEHKSSNSSIFFFFK